MEIKPTYILHKSPEGFIIISNQQPVNGLYLDTYINKVKNTNGAEYGINEITKQVIAQQDQIDFSNLTEKEQEEIGWFTQIIRNNAFEHANKHNKENCGHKLIMAYIEGFKKAQEVLSDRRFTLAEVEKLMYWSAEMASGKRDSGHGYTQIVQELENKIKYLSQPKSWNIEIETECSVCGLTGVHKMSCKTPSLRTQQPRFTNGKIKITKVL